MDRAAIVTALKETGKRAFGRQRYGAAADAYSEGIALTADADGVFTTEFIAMLHVNRALARKALPQPPWDVIEADALRALQLDSRNAKALYLLGLAAGLRQDWKTAITRLALALETARRQNTRFSPAILLEFETSLATHRAASFDARIAEERAADESLQIFLDSALASHERALISEFTGGRGGGAFEDVVSAARGAVAERRIELQRIFDAREASRRRCEPPESFSCPISFELMTDPVVTVPGGHSYSRAALSEFIENAGGVADPVTRLPLSAATVHDNHALKDAVASWLEAHPYAHPLLIRQRGAADGGNPTDDFVA